jgi:hypothetical protein
VKKIFLYFFSLSLFEWLNLLHIFINDSCCVKVEDTFMWCSPFLQARFETTLLAPCCSATSLQIFYNKQVKFNDTLVDWMTSSDIDFGFWTWQSKNRTFCCFFVTFKFEILVDLVLYHSFEIWNVRRLVLQSGPIEVVKRFKQKQYVLRWQESPNSDYIHDFKLANAISLNVISYNVAIFSKWINISN